MSTAIQKVGTGWAIAPANMTELYRFAELLAGSDLVPKDYRDKPGNCMVAIQMGGELGLSPMQSIQNIAVINGRPSLWGDALLAVCLPHLDEFEETDDGNTATCRAVRGKRTVTTTFSMEDAKRAGLAGKAGPWSQYPARMRKMRARSFTLRDICADILRGIHSAEETQDIPREVRAEVTSSKPVEEPKPQPERKSEPPPKAAKPDVPCFAVSWPNESWNGLPMSEAPIEVFDDYARFLQGMLADPKKKKFHAHAGKSLADAEAEVNRRLDEESDKIAAPHTEPSNTPDDSVPQEGDRDGWGLTP